MWALDFLGLDTGADEKAIKRAYAKQLKVTRPDDDPAAFQQLNEAYQNALTWCKNKAQQDRVTLRLHENQEPKEDGQHQLPVKNHEISITSSPTSLHAFYKQCMKIITMDDAQALNEWLTQNSALIHDEQNALTQIFLNNWQKYLPPVPYKCFDVIDELLQLNNIQLRTILNTIWESKQKLPTNIKAEYLSDTIDKQSNQDSLIDSTQFCQECIQVSQQNNPEKLKLWLNTQQILWALPNKKILGERLIGYLIDNPIALHKDCFSVITNFFDFNRVQNNLDYQTISNLENKLHSLWLFSPQHIAQLKANHKKTFRFSSKQLGLENNWQLLEQLQKPFSWLQASFASIPLRRAKYWGNCIIPLAQNIDYQIPNTINRKQIEFWLSFNYPGLHPAILMFWTIISIILTVFSLPLTIPMIYTGLLTQVEDTTLRFLALIPISVSLAGISIFIIVSCMWYWFWIKKPYNQFSNRLWQNLSIAWTPILSIAATIFYLKNHNIYMLLIGIVMINTYYYYVYVVKYTLPNIPGFLISLFIIGTVLLLSMITAFINNLSTSHQGKTYYVILTAVLLTWFAYYLLQKRNNNV